MFIQKCGSHGVKMGPDTYLWVVRMAVFEDKGIGATICARVMKKTMSSQVASQVPPFRYILGKTEPGL